MLWQGFAPPCGSARGGVRRAVSASPATTRSFGLPFEGQWAGRDSNPQDGTPSDASKATAFASFATGPLTLKGLCQADGCADGYHYRFKQRNRAMQIPKTAVENRGSRYPRAETGSSASHGLWSIQ